MADEKKHIFRVFRKANRDEAKLTLGCVCVCECDVPEDGDHCKKKKATAWVPPDGGPLELSWESEKGGSPPVTWLHAKMLMKHRQTGTPTFVRERMHWASYLR